MEQYRPESFARHSQHVRNPMSSRRKRRLQRLALGCAAVTAAAIALFAVGLSGL